MNVNPTKPARIAVGLLLGAAFLALGGSLFSARADDSPRRPVHPDCTDNPNPQMCTETITELRSELDQFNQFLNPPNVDEIMKFYHEDVIHYISAAGIWIRGRQQLRNLFWAPFSALITGGSFDWSPYHYQVIGPNLVVTYGAIPATGYLKSGGTLSQPPLPQTVTWIRNPEHDPLRPFVVISDHE
jgi:hypothetical protein